MQKKSIFVSIPTTVVTKLVRVITRTKVAIMSYYPQYVAVIAYNTETVLWFWFRVTLWRIAYYARGIIYPQFGNHCVKTIMTWQRISCA